MLDRASCAFASKTMAAAALLTACHGSGTPSGSTGTGSMGGSGTGSSGATMSTTGSGAVTSSTGTGGPNAVTAWCASHATMSTTVSSGSLSFDLDLCKGPARQNNPPAAPVAVSSYVYGINAGSLVAKTTKWGLIRQGGDDDSAYNWTNDYSNAGGDFCYFQGPSGSGNLGGRYTDAMGDTIPAALAKGEAFLATVPILDYVAATYGRNTGWDTAANAGDVCPGTDPQCGTRSGSLRANVVDKAQGDPNFGSTLTFAYKNDGSMTPAGSPAFVPNVMSKGSALCSCAPGTKTCSGCAVGTNPVAQDEFVNFLKVNYGTGAAPIFFDLDNEPNYWVGTHPEIYPNQCSTGSVTWDDVVKRNVAAATAVKKVWSAAKVFGPVVSGDGMAYGGDYASPHFVAGTTEFSDWYLAQVAAASVSANTPLLDVFDVHYYTVGNSDAQCLESPRLFWDPNATDISAAETNSLDFNYGDHTYWDQHWYPRKVIPRLFGKIATAYAGKSVAPPGLSFSEYNPGCEKQISGGVAEADLLGIFGREGVFAAMAWPLQDATGNYLEAAYDLYRNYDGKGAVVGDFTMLSTASDPKNTSVYGFVHSDDVMSVEIVAINKATSAGMVTLHLASAPSFTTVTAYHLVGGNPSVVADSGGGEMITCASGTCTVSFTMPATSATTLVLR